MIVGFGQLLTWSLNITLLIIDERQEIGAIRLRS